MQLVEIRSNKSQPKEKSRTVIAHYFRSRTKQTKQICLDLWLADVIVSLYKQCKNSPSKYSLLLVLGD